MQEVQRRWKKYERLLRKGTSFAKADEVWTAWYKKGANIRILNRCFFLIPQTQDRATSSNYSPVTVSNGEEDTDERREDEEGSKVQPKRTQSERNTSRKINKEQQLLEKREHIDEDKTFLLSLVR